MTDPTICDYINDTSGVTYTDLQFESQEDLDDLIELYVDNCLDWINNKTYHNYTTTTIPNGLRGVVIDMVKRLLVNDSIRQDNPISDVEDYKVFELVEKVITEDLVKRVEPYIESMPLTSYSIE
jgi:hypothetical protein